jgi:hypothetical protein
MTDGSLCIILNAPLEWNVGVPALVGTVRMPLVSDEDLDPGGYSLGLPRRKAKSTLSHRSSFASVTKPPSTRSNPKKGSSPP